MYSSILIHIDFTFIILIDKYLIRLFFMLLKLAMIYLITNFLYSIYSYT